MPDLNGVAVFDQLVARGLIARLPVIFLTGHGDVPMAVDSLKRGAFDFFEKPFDGNRLMDRVEEALALSRQAGATALVQARLASLSAREREVLDLILAGKMNKVIADQLGISMRTVEVHRAHVFDKMQVKTAVELAGLLKVAPLTAGCCPGNLGWIEIEQQWQNDIERNGCVSAVKHW